jgi:hypothetical protein
LVEFELVKRSHTIILCGIRYKTPTTHSWEERREMGREKERDEEN